MNISEDGGRVAFLAAHNTIYRDGELFRSYGSAQVSFPLTMSGDGSVLAWKVRPSGDVPARIVVNGIEGELYGDASLPVVSHDGRVVAYRAAEEDGPWFIVVNERRISPAYEEVTPPAVSRDGRVIAYGAEGDRHLLVVGDRILPIAQPAKSVFLSADGAAWGYVTGTAVVTERGMSESFEEVQEPSFSPDGRRVAFAGRLGSSWFVVVDNRKVPAPGLVGGPKWSVDGSQVGYGALLGRELWWKVIR